MTPDQVTVNVVTAGGSFGRRLFFDGALEAAEISQAMGKPVKLMWHRADDARVGRGHPMGTCRVRATVRRPARCWPSSSRYTSVETDFRHGLGEIITAKAADLPGGLGNLGFAETIFALTQEVPYDFGAVTQTLTETDDRFNTGVMRNIYSPDVRVAGELVVDQLAASDGQGPLRVPAEVPAQRAAPAPSSTRSPRSASGASDAGRHRAGHRDPQGVQGRQRLPGRDRLPARDRPAATIRDGGHRPAGHQGDVRRSTSASSINPRGLEAQMQGGINDGIALALTSSLHLRDGHFLEASWDNYFYTRQWNTPPEVEVIVMPSDREASPVAPARPASRRPSRRSPAPTPGRPATSRRTSRSTTSDLLASSPSPSSRPIPQSPTNGLDLTS